MISPADGSLTIRHSRSDDAPALRRLAELHSTEVPNGALLVAEVDGELRAALALETGRAIADPFRATSHLVHLLEVARHEAPAGGMRPHGRRFSRAGFVVGIRHHGRPPSPVT